MSRLHDASKNKGRAVVLKIIKKSEDDSMIRKIRL